jgi:hypothetical protein
VTDPRAEARRYRLPRTRRAFCQSLAGAGAVSLAGCTGNGRDDAGDLRIENEDGSEHTVHVRISEVVPATESAPSATTVTPEFRVDERYTVSPDAVTKVGSVGRSEESGHVKVTAELETGAAIERWIEIPTADVWTVHIASDGAFTWWWVGVE